MGQQYLSTDPTAGDPIKVPASALSREQVYQQARRQMEQPEIQQGEPGLMASLARLLEPGAYPQSLDDVGHLLMAPTDATRSPMLLQQILKFLPQRITRQNTGTAIERLGQELQHPIQAPGRLVEGVGKVIKGPQPEVPPPVPKPRPGSFEEFITADPTRRAEISAAREAYRLQPRTSARAAAPGGTPSAVPPASTPPGSAPAASMRLTPQESQHLQQLVAEGFDEADVLQAIARVRQETPTPPMASTQTPGPKMSGGAATGPGRLAKTKAATGAGADESAMLKEYHRLKALGKSDAEAFDLIQRMKTMEARLGLPSSAKVQRSVYDRNLTGRWDE